MLRRESVRKRDFMEHYLWLRVTNSHGSPCAETILKEAEIAFNILEEIHSKDTDYG